MKGLSGILEKILQRFAAFQYRAALPIALVLIILTLVLATGWTQLELESDFSSMNPEGLPVTELTSDVEEDFNTLSSVVIVIKLNPSVDSTRLPHDIRDPEVFRFLVRLSDQLEQEPRVQNVVSPAMAFPQGVPDDSEQVKQVVASIPQLDQVISDDYSFMIVVVGADLGGDSQKIKEFSDRIDQLISYASPPGGVTVVTTGETPLGATIFNLMINDAVTTTIIALAVIFALLLLIQRSFKDALIIIIPLCIGISWTYSILGLTGIAINIGTAGLSAMLIGLGVEYNIFLVSRFKEARQEKSRKDALVSAVSTIGASILSSGGTTVIGFFALATSIFPILAELGLSLGIGIISLLGTTLLVTPLLLNLQDRLFGNKKKNKTTPQRVKQLFRRYGTIVAHHPWWFIGFAVVFFVLMLAASQNLNNQDMDFDTILPDNLEAMQAFTLIQNEWGETENLRIYLEVLPDAPVSNDIRYPTYLRYIKVLTQQAEHATNVASVTSISQEAKNGQERLPNTLTEAKTLLSAGDLISEDYRISLIKIELYEGLSSEEILRQLREILDTVPQPPGIKARLIGGLAVQYEQDAVFGPDSTRTSLIALAGIIVFLFILTRSFKGTFFPITTVILSVIWTLGLSGVFRIPFNNITSSVITMTIGIGIDFGIQLYNRYVFELQRHDKRKAMEETLANVLTPMLITVVAAVIGFRAMIFGELNIMGDLGATMSFAIAASMLASITGVAGLLVVTQKEKKHAVPGQER